MDYRKYKHLRVTSEGNVVTVALNRPEVGNAINGELQHELCTIFLDLDMDDGCDVVILTSTGPCFSGGGDLSWILSMWGDPVTSSAANRIGRRVQNSLLELEKPIIAKVRGPAVGPGCSLALFCDFVYATPESTFADPHVTVGLVAGDGGALMWPQLIGYARARRYLLTGDPISGSEAADIGLITAAVPEEQLDQTVEKMARRMANGATFAIKWTKATINAGLKVTANAVIDRATAFESLTQMTADNRVAAQALLENKTPKFVGS
jgi:enoyl-CoA hydratase